MLAHHFCGGKKVSGRVTRFVRRRSPKADIMAWVKLWVQQLKIKILNDIN
jgi:hypothetical protein